MRNGKERGAFSQIIKGAFSALITALIGVLIFAWIIKLASLNGTVVKAVNQFIKILSVFLGCFFSLRNGFGLIKGLVVGSLSALLISLTFALIVGNLSINSGMALDVLVMAIVGGISGIVSVNLKKD